MDSHERPRKLTLHKQNSSPPSSANWDETYLSQISPNHRKKPRDVNFVSNSSTIQERGKNTLISPNSSRNSPFRSRIDLLSLDLKAQIQTIKTHLSLKNSFLDIFRSDFCQNSSIDLTKYGNKSFKPFLESTIFHPLDPIAMENLRGKIIAAVDGGTGVREYLGLDITLIKVALVIYDFADPFHPAISYYPILKNDENYSLFTDFGVNRTSNMGALVNFRRILAENTIVIQMLENVNPTPDLIILDGSLQIPPISNFYALIHSHPKLCYDVFESYRRLYTLCHDNDISLIGSVKDSKIPQFRDLIIRALPFYLKTFFSAGQGNSLLTVNYRRHLQGFSDYELLFQVLEPSFRTAIVHQKKDFRLNPPSLSNFSASNLQSSESDDIYALSRLFGVKFPYGIMYSYLRFSKQDLPLRFEFLVHPNSSIQQNLSLFHEAIRILSPISVIESQCTLPLPQIEAHLRAHLPPRDLDMIVKPLTAQFNIPLQEKHNRNSSVNAATTSSVGSNPSANPQIITPVIDSEISSGISTYSPFFEKRHVRLDQLF
ncbi:MAG: DNA double-strand break repair nuclease NurA [Promethearchaeota archaeon]